MRRISKNLFVLLNVFNVSQNGTPWQNFSSRHSCLEVVQVVHLLTSVEILIKKSWLVAQVSLLYLLSLFTCRIQWQLTKCKISFSTKKSSSWISWDNKPSIENKSFSCKYPILWIHIGYKLKMYPCFAENLLIGKPSFTKYNQSICFCSTNYITPKLGFQNHVRKWSANFSRYVSNCIQLYPTVSYCIQLFINHSRSSNVRKKLI